MAKIEMDVSEWNLMKDKERLLEESLAREVLNNDKIRVLEKEKIGILEANEKKVTIVTYTQTTESLQIPRSANEIYQRMISRLKEGNSRDSHRGMMSDHHWHVMYGSDEAMNDISYLQSLFYSSKSEIRNQDGKDRKSVTTQGLDQVQEDIAIKYDKERSTLHIEEQDRAKEIFKRHNELVDECDEKSKTITINNKVIKDLESDVQSLMKKKHLSDKMRESVIAESVPASIVHRTRELLKSTTWLTRKEDYKALQKLWRRE